MVAHAIVYFYINPLQKYVYRADRTLESDVSFIENGAMH